MATDNKPRERLYSGFKKLLTAPNLVRRSSDSFSFVNRLSSLSMSTPSPADDSGGRASINSLTAKGYDEAALSAAARAAADELMGKKKRERRPSFSFASWREKHRSKKHPEPIEEDKKPVQPEDEVAPQHESQSPSSPHRTRTRSHGHSGHEHRKEKKERKEQEKRERKARSKSRDLSGETSTSTQVLPPMGTVPTPIPRTPGNQITPTAAAQRRRAATPTSSSSSSSRQPLTPKYSFSERQHENSRIKDCASTMVVDDVVVRPRPQVRQQHRARPPSCSWDSDSEDDDKFEDSSRPRGLAGRSISMDCMEPQQAPNHLMSKIWRKLPIQARLLGRGSIDLDLEKDRVSFTRSSQSKALRMEQHTEEFSICASPLPASTDDDAAFGPKNLRFNFRLTYFPSAAPNVALESYDDILVRVCQFAKHDTRRTAVKVQEFLERSMAYIRGTTSRRGQKVSISNEEIRMWRRLARHDWEAEEVTTAPAPLPETETTKTRGESTASSITEDDTETDEDDVIVPDEPKLQQLVDAVNYCVGSGDSLFRMEDVEELIKLEFLVEEDGWI